MNATELLAKYSKGLRNFREANLKGANLEGANLEGANLFWSNLEDADLRGADLEGANLERANLKGANLEGANLQDVNLQRASLQGADLRGARFLIKIPIPVIPNIHKVLWEKISIPDQGNHLDMDSWHTCETTHCRAGWIIVLAGELGKELEDLIGTSAAASLIYMASDPTLERIPDWFASNEEALVDIKRLANVSPM